MNTILDKKIHNLLYSPPDQVELYIITIKVIWSLYLIFSNISNQFYFINSQMISVLFGIILLFDAILKFGSYITDHNKIRKLLALAGMVGWIFIIVGTLLSKLPNFTMIQFLVLMVGDAWLYLRLGALNNDRS